MAFAITERTNISRRPIGPLSPYVADLANWAAKHGYAARTQQEFAARAADFSRWCAKRDITLPNIYEDHATVYLAQLRRRRYFSTIDASALRYLLALLLRNGVVVEQKRELTSVERCLQGFRTYLQNQRGFAPRSITNHSYYAGVFLLDRYKRTPVKLGTLLATDIISFVAREARPDQQSRSKLLTTALRSFLRYAFFIAATDINLSAAVPTVAAWSMSSIPRAISRAHVRRVLAVCDRRTLMGKRDYAIILLLVRLGLRAAEVASLLLTDIDWKEGSLTVRGKMGRVDQLPLPADVGAAIAKYLQCGRLSSDRRVFLQLVAPFQGLRNSKSIGSVTRRLLKRAGVNDSPTTGAHQFRHALAAWMLQGGATIGQIGDVLRHRNPNTTMLYTKVDVEALRTLALPWPVQVR
jgi:site-specific recombinase XerD